MTPELLLAIASYCSNLSITTKCVQEHPQATTGPCLKTQESDERDMCQNRILRCVMGDNAAFSKTLRYCIVKELEGVK